MNKQIVPQTIAFDNLVQMHNQEVTTTSKIVADNFEKLHKNVLSKIEQLSLETPEDWYQLNFKPIQIETDLGQNRSRLDKAYEMTKDGFMLLVMGFTGKKAMELKIRFIQAFNWAFDQLQKSTSKQREVLIRACEKLAVGRMARPQAYALVANQFGYDKPIDIPVPLIPEATEFAYETFIRLQKSEPVSTDEKETAQLVEAVLRQNTEMQDVWDGLRYMNREKFSRWSNLIVKTNVLAESLSNKLSSQYATPKVDERNKCIVFNDEETKRINLNWFNCPA